MYDKYLVYPHKVAKNPWGSADRHFVIMILLFRLARNIILKSLPTLISDRSACSNAIRYDKWNKGTS
jgi:hypothetical protein